MQLYTLTTPVYGPENYTTLAKSLSVSNSKVDNVLTGAGNQESDNARLEPVTKDLATADMITDESSKNDNSEVLNELNKKNKDKLNSSIYSSFLHPNAIKTGSISLGGGMKRKFPSKSSEMKNTVQETNSKLEAHQKGTESKKIKHKFLLI